MKRLTFLLEQIPDDEAVHIVFSDDEELELKNCEQVDESIYNKTDVMMGEVEKQIVVKDKRFSTPGSIIEFSINDIVRVTSAVNDKVLFKRS